jgi:ankyrin repeat protein
VNAQETKTWNTQLHYAALQSHDETFELLLELGADPTVENMNKSTPIQYALMKGNLTLIKRLLRLPSFLSICSTNKMLQFLVQNELASGLLLHSCLYFYKHPDINVTDRWENSLLMLASQAENHVAVQDLLLAGADPCYRTSSGKTVLHVCAEENSVACSGPILQMLIISNQVDKLKLLWYATDEKLNTPMHICCRDGNLGFAVHLLNHGCPCDMRGNAAGKRPVDLAVINNHDVLACLISLRMPSNSDPFKYWIEKKARTSTSPPPPSNEIKKSLSPSQSAFSSPSPLSDYFPPMNKARLINNTIKIPQRYIDSAKTFPSLSSFPNPPPLKTCDEMLRELKINDLHCEPSLKILILRFRQRASKEYTQALINSMNNTYYDNISKKIFLSFSMLRFSLCTHRHL